MFIAGFYLEESIFSYDFPIVFCTLMTIRMIGIGIGRASPICSTEGLSAVGGTT